MLKIDDPFTHKPRDIVERLYIYNGLDSPITREVFDETYPQLDDITHQVYNFERSQRAPALDIMLRGIRIDVVKRSELAAQADIDYAKVYSNLQKLAEAAWDKGLNPNSSKQCKALFYETMGLPEQKVWDSKKRKMRVSTNRESLEKLTIYLHAVPFINCILRLREMGKRNQFLRCTLDSNGRFRSSCNVGATETGRWSSSKHVTGIGDNNQNIEHEGRKGEEFAIRALRSMFIADEGMKMANADLEQAESREVAYLSGDKNYIKAHEAGDPHTMVAGLCFDLPLTGNLKTDKELADQPYYRHFSYRDMAKRGGHATNYFAKPHTIARHLKIPESVAKEFQRIYFATFPGIRKWQNSIISILQKNSYITTPLICGNYAGRRRYFFSRPSDEETIKEAIAYQPQSMIADVLNMGLCRVYELYRSGLPIQLLQQGHDAILYQFPEGMDEEIIPIVEDAMRIKHIVNDRKVIIPVETKTGFDWHNTKVWRENTNALRPPVRSLLDQRASSVW